MQWFRDHPDYPPFARLAGGGIAPFDLKTRAAEFNWKALAAAVLGPDSDDRVALRWWGWTQAHGSPEEMSLSWLLARRPSLGSRSTVYRRRDKALKLMSHSLNNRLQILVAIEARQKAGKPIPEEWLAELAPREETVRRVNEEGGLAA